MRNFESNRGFLLRNSIELILKNLEKNIIVTCFTKLLLDIHLLSNMLTNDSYERDIIVLSFPVISFVILIFVFQRFEIKSGFPFFDSHCIYPYVQNQRNICWISPPISESLIASSSSARVLGFLFVHITRISLRALLKSVQVYLANIICASLWLYPSLEQNESYCPIGNMWESFSRWSSVTFWAGVPERR